MQNKDAELLHAPFAQFPVHRISFRREPTMNADRDRLWNAERNVSPLASGVALADGYDAGLLLEKTSDRFAA